MGRVIGVKLGFWSEDHVPQGLKLTSKADI